MGFLIDGVDIRADLPLLIVLGPQLFPFQKPIQMLKKILFGCMVSDTMTFTTAPPFFQFETFLKGLHLESMKSAEIAARQMEAFPAEQFVTTPVYVLFL